MAVTVADIVRKRIFRMADIARMMEMDDPSEVKEYEAKLYMVSAVDFVGNRVQYALVDMEDGGESAWFGEEQLEFVRRGTVEQLGKLKEKYLESLEIPKEKVEKKIRKPSGEFKEALDSIENADEHDFEKAIEAFDKMWKEAMDDYLSGRR